jgi:hypothetical protein
MSFYETAHKSDSAVLTLATMSDLRQIEIILLPKLAQESKELSPKTLPF